MCLLVDLNLIFHVRVKSLLFVVICRSVFLSLTLLLFYTFCSLFFTFSFFVHQFALKLDKLPFSVIFICTQCTGSLFGKFHFANSLDTFWLFILCLYISQYLFITLYLWTFFSFSLCTLSLLLGWDSPRYSIVILSSGISYNWKRSSQRLRVLILLNLSPASLEIPLSFVTGCFSRRMNVKLKYKYHRSKKSIFRGASWSNG